MFSAQEATIFFISDRTMIILDQLKM